jgi:hypothetical protein
MKVVKKQIPSIDGKGIMMGRPAFTDDLAASDSLIIKILEAHMLLLELNPLTSKMRKN